MIRFENMTRRYGARVAVEGLTLSIPPGEVFAFLGPNGAGKTTTIKTLVGLLRPTSGRVTVCGFDTVTQTREATQRIGYVPEEAFLYDKLTGREFLQFVVQIRGMAGTAGEEAIARQADQFALHEFLDDLTETYSHGMKQRLVFAAALLHDPPVLVVDEPTVGLDPKSTRLVKDLLRRRAAEGKSVFMSTHTLSLAEEIADRIGIIDEGRLDFLGTQSDLARQLCVSGHSLENLFLRLTAEGNGRQRSARAESSVSGSAG